MMKCPCCGKEKGEDLIQLHPIHEDYSCYECMPESLREKYDAFFNDQRVTEDL